MSTAFIAPLFIHASVKRRKNTWYSIANGNWTDPNIWMSNALSYSDKLTNTYPGQSTTLIAPVFPQVGDDVFINHSVTINAASLIVNNVYVSGSLLFDSTARAFTVNGDFQATGTLNMSNAAHNLILMGVNNYVVNFTSGTNGTVTYARSGDQDVMNLSYRHLAVFGIGTKYQTSNLTTLGALTINAFGNTIVTNYEIGNYDLSVSGQTSVTSNAFLRKSGTGNLTFIGLLFVGQFGALNSNVIFSGNPTIELRGGYTQNGVSGTINFGTGVISLNTNSQNITISAGSSIFTNAVVTGSITVTNISAAGKLQINNYLDGTVAGSAFINKGSLYFNTTTLPMVTAGSFDCMTFSTNIIGHIASGSYTLPYTSYQGLVVGGGGIKSFSGAGTVNTTTALQTATTLALAGASLFIGTVTGGSGAQTLDCGVHAAEFRGSINSIIGTGSGLWTFTTNNQSITALGQSIANDILISGAITLSLPVSNTHAFFGKIDGNNALSTLDCRGTANYISPTRPMVTGVLQVNAAANTWLYNLAGAQDITGGTYRTLTLAGSGVKTLQGNVVVATLYTLTAPATLNLNGFTRT